MISIGISEFRTNLKSILLRVQNGEIISLKQRGTEIARLVPPSFAQVAARQELENLRQTAHVGDVVSPLDELWIAIEKNASNS